MPTFVGPSDSVCGEHVLLFSFTDETEERVQVADATAVSVRSSLRTGARTRGRARIPIRAQPGLPRISVSSWGTHPCMRTKSRLRVRVRRVTADAGAQRLLRIRVEEGWRVRAALPLRWSLPEFSPHLRDTGP